MFQKKRNTFHGGVHPYEGKELSRTNRLSKRSRATYCITQCHSTSERLLCRSYKRRPCKSWTKKIAEAGGFVSAPVYASVSGTVKGIGEKVSAAGSPVDCIVVENDGMYEKEAFEDALIGKNSTQIRSGRRSKKPESSEWEVRVSRHTSRYHRKDPSAIDHILVNGAGVRTPISDKRLPQNDRGSRKR